MGPRAWRPSRWRLGWTWVGWRPSRWGFWWAWLGWRPSRGFWWAWLGWTRLGRGRVGTGIWRFWGRFMQLIIIMLLLLVLLLLASRVLWPMVRWARWASWAWWASSILKGHLDLLDLYLYWNSLYVLHCIGVDVHCSVPLLVLYEYI